MEIGHSGGSGTPGASPSTSTGRASESSATRETSSSAAFRSPGGRVAGDSSFDVVSRIDEQELENALNQARKEIASRFDFKNSKTSIEKSGKEIIVVSDDELKLKNVIDIIQSRAVKRGISIKAFEYGKVEPAAQGTVRRRIILRTGIPKEKSKPLIDAIKSSKLKVNAQYQDEQIRVWGKSKDDLQKVIALLRELDYELPLQFVNYR